MRPSDRYAFGAELQTAADAVRRVSYGLDSLTLRQHAYDLEQSAGKILDQAIAEMDRDQQPLIYDRCAQCGSGHPQLCALEAAGRPRCRQ